MKLKQVKKLLSITVASTMLVTGTPDGLFMTAAEAPADGQKAEDSQKDEKSGSNTDNTDEKDTDTKRTDKKSETDETEKEETDKKSSTDETEKEETDKKSSTDGTEKEETDKKSETDGTNKEETGTKDNTGEQTDKGTDKDTQGDGQKTSTNPVWNFENKTEFTYDGKDHTPSLDTADKDIVYTIVKDGEVVSNATEPGSYTVTATGGSLSEAKTISFKINKVKVSLEWGNYDWSPIYTGEDIESPKAAFKDINGTSQDVTVKVTCGEPAESTEIKNAGSYTVTATLSEEQSKYYVLSDGKTTETKDLTVAPKSVNVEWTGSDTVFYDGNLHALTCNSKEYTGDIQITYYKAGDTNRENPITEGVTELGTYTAVASIENQNYSVSEGTQSKSLQINLPSVEWSLDGADADHKVVYDGKEHMPTATVKEDAASGLKITYTVTVNETQVLENQEKPTIPGFYTVKAYAGENQSAEHCLGEYAFTIAKKKVSLTWDKDYNWNPTYNGNVIEVPKATFEGINGENPEVTVTCDKKEIKDAGDYQFTATLDETQSQYYEFENNAETQKALTVNKAPVKIKANEGQEKYYGADEPKLEYSVDLPDDTTVNEEKVRGELGDAPLIRDKVGTPEGENAGEYDINLNIAPTNYDITYESAKFTIKQLPVTVTAEPKELYYGAKEQELTYKVEIGKTETGETIETKTTKTEENVRDAIDEITGGKTLTRAGEDGKNNNNAGTYTIKFNEALTGATEGDIANYAITYVTGTYTIKQLPVIITPVSGQEKIFGEKDPGVYEYDVKIKEEATKKTKLSASDVEGELGKQVITREEGENVGAHAYKLLSKEDDGTNFKNFDITLATGDNVPQFTIHSVEITSLDAITSRQGEFSVGTNITGDRTSKVSTKIKVEAKFPNTVDGISFATDIDDYITDASKGVEFESDSKVLSVENVTYEKPRKDSKKKKITWNGKLPAGTELTISIVDGEGNTVSKESKTVTVGKTPVSIGWGATKQSSTGNYVEPKTALVLTGSSAGEKTEVLYSQTKGGAAAASYYDSTNLSFVPEINDSNSTHVMQSITANVVDTLNLDCTPQTLDFYVDDLAFPISSSAIQFENRGKEITIQLPEKGTITNVSIPGAKVEVTGGTSDTYKLAVSWSGKQLISTGAPITVTYKDEAGHEGTGTASASQSSVTTPITFKIRPELNANGYLNGQRGNTLIISGVACASEPIRVTVAGMSQTTNAAQQEVWSDSNGAWEVAFDMSRLPEGEDFNISAEYMDVSGSSYSMTAKYEAFVAPASVKSPIYEAMSHISGMVEPGTAVALVVNGDTSKYYELDVDRFGRISMDDVPMMFGGEDSFDIYVQDIAGNTSIQHYDIAQPEDPFEVTAQVNPLGTYFFRAEQSLSDVYAATPVSAADFEDSDTLELPLIMGMSYEVGKMTITKNDEGIVVTSDIQPSEDIDAEDYKVENEKLYVYRTRPTVDDLRDKTGEEVQYGDVIPLGENETVWLVDSKDMTILAEDMEELTLFNYDESKEYEAYQEK